jgi:hypothetical protein
MAIHVDFVAQMEATLRRLAAGGIDPSRLSLAQLAKESGIPEPLVREAIEGIGRKPRSPRPPIRAFRGKLPAFTPRPTRAGLALLERLRHGSDRIYDHAKAYGHERNWPAFVGCWSEDQVDEVLDEIAHRFGD